MSVHRDTSSHLNTCCNFGLYIHWPFCASKCPYCDFNSHITREIDHISWCKAILCAMDHEASRIPTGCLSSIFFGGGTPSLMEPIMVATLLDRAVAHWPIVDGIEVTLEVNPGTVECSKLIDFRVAGINRLSIGVQSLDDEALRWLGRTHSANQAVTTVNLAQRLFPYVSFDLIYARPWQTPKSWRIELERAIAIATDHLSLYQLTIEPGTIFSSEHERGKFSLPNEDVTVTLYHISHELTTAAGLPAYEISNHARKGAECKHNLNLWRGGNTIGVGPGAHGRLTGCDGVTIATYQHANPEIWLTSIGSGNYSTSYHLSLRERVTELLLMGLRLTTGISRPLFRRLSGCNLEEVLNLEAIKYLEGYVILDDAGLRATLDGRLILNEIQRQILI